MTISDKASEAILNNMVLMGRLMGMFDRSQQTVENWIDSKDMRLTTADCVKTIAEVSGLSEAEILEEEKVSETN